MGKLNLPEVKFWLEEAENCVQRQKEELIKRNNYPALIAYYEGQLKLNANYPYVGAKDEYAIINEFFPNANSLISELMYQNPDILVEATKPSTEEGGSVMKGALQFAFDKTEAIIENRLALFDMLFAGYAGVEVDHSREKDDIFNLPSKEVMASRERGLIGKLVDKVTGNDKVEEEETKSLATPEESRSIENTFIRRWNPLNVPLDWKAETLKDRRYNLKKVWLSKAEFDAKYPDFKDKIFPGDNDEYEYAKFTNKLYSSKILLYEFQIKRKGGVYENLVLSPNYTLSEIDYYERPYVMNGFNMKIGQLHKYGKLYPVSIAQVNKKICDEMNRYARFMMEVAERNIPKVVVAKERVKEDGKEALESKAINAVVEVTGQTTAGAIQPLTPTNVSVENKELGLIFQQQKEKLWTVSDTRLTGKSGSQFATEVEIQEAGFQARQSDIQEGLRQLIKEELEALKDIIVVFWDGEYFFKITDKQKPMWYIPQKGLNPLTGQEMILNPLTDILTNDYDIKVDISSALKPNKERRKKEIVDFLTWLTSPGVAQYLMSQGKTINLEDIKKAGEQFGFNPETMLVDVQPPPMPGMPGEAGINEVPAQTGGMV